MERQLHNTPALRGNMKRELNAPFSGERIVYAASNRGIT
jgi:hypothetical protein